jgi:hypothetical protein
MFHDLGPIPFSGNQRLFFKRSPKAISRRSTVDSTTLPPMSCRNSLAVIPGRAATWSRRTRSSAGVSFRGHVGPGFPGSNCPPTARFCHSLAVDRATSNLLATAAADSPFANAATTLFRKSIE